MTDEMPPALAAPAEPDEIPDDIGNRIEGGARDVTREKVGEKRGGRPSPTPLLADDTDEDDEPQPDFNVAEPTPAPRAKRARKTAAKKTAAKRTTTRKKKES